MKNSLILLVAASLVGATGGFIVGKNTSPAPAGSGGEERVVSRTRAGGRPEGLVDNGARRPAAKGIDEIVKLPGSPNQIQHAMIEFYAGLSVEQLEEEARKLKDLSKDEREMAGLLLFARWGELDGLSAMDHAKGMGYSGAVFMPTIFQNWAIVDPMNAARYYEKSARELGLYLDINSFNDVGCVIASEWVKEDPQAALTWVNSLNSREFKKVNTVSRMVCELANTDPAKAAQMLSGLNANDTSLAYYNLALKYGSKNFTEAQSWIQSLPADQQGLMIVAINGLADTDLNAAAAHVATMAAGGYKDSAVNNVARSMARQNPQAAAEYVMKNGSANAQEDSMYSVVPEWVKKDPAAALSYVNTMPEGEARDYGLCEYVKCNSSAPSSELVQVAESISDERNRNDAVNSLVQRWMHEDEAAAKAYIQDSPYVYDGIKERLLGKK